MDPENQTHEREEALFLEASELSGPERAAFLDRECAGQPALRQRLESLLAAHAEDETLLTRIPVAGIREAASSAPLNDQSVGAVLGGRYRILEKIGEGGCGVVYVAEQIEPIRRKVALKVIKPGMDSHAVIARFEAERQALAMMDHPYIARVFDAGTTDEPPSPPSPSESPGPAGVQLPAPGFATGRPYFVMEWVQGQRVTDYCDAKRLGVRQRVELFIKVCEAIQHAHQKGVIHRDIKPSNILVTRPEGAVEATPKVIDFGISKAVQGRLTDATAHTDTRLFLGTPAYMSPEQADSRELDIDTRADIYSLGVLLYELLAGRPPFDSKALLASGIEGMRRTICESEPPRPSARLTTLDAGTLQDMLSRRQSEAGGLARQLRGDLDWIVMKCLEKDRSRRYATAGDLAADLRRHLNHEPVLARPPSAAYRLTRSWRRHRVAYSAGITVAGILMASVVVLSRALRNQTIAREAAEEARVQQGIERDRAASLLAAAQAARGVELLEKNDPVGLLHLLEARKTVNHLPEESARFTLLWSGWFEAIPKPETQTLRSAGARHSITFGHPWIAAGGSQGNVMIWRAETGEEVGAFSAGDQPIFALELSGNGRLLIVHTHGEQQLWDLGRSRSNQWPALLARNIRRHAFDPHRRILVTLSGGESRRLTQLPVLEDSEEARATYKVEVWNSHLDDPLTTTWDGSRLDLVNDQFAVSPDGSVVASGSQSVTLWDAATGALIPTQLATNDLPGVRGFFDPLAFSPDGRWLWEARGDFCVRHDLSTGRPSGDPLTGLNRQVHPRISDSGRHWIITFQTGYRILDLNSGEFMGPLIPHDDDVAMTARALSRDGRRLLTWGLGRGTRIWETLTGRPEGPPIVLSSQAIDASFSPDGERLAIVTRDGRHHIRRLGAAEPELSRKWPGHWLVGLNAEGHALVFTRGDRSLQWIDPWTGSITGPKWELSEPGTLYGAALSADGRLIATAVGGERKESVVQVWEAGPEPRVLTSIAWPNIGTVNFNRDGRLLGGLGEDGSIHVWDAATGELRAKMEWPQPMEVGWFALHFSPDSRFVAARNSYTISVWDTAEKTLPPGMEEEFHIAISADWRFAIRESGVLDFSDPHNPKPAPPPPGSRSGAHDPGGLAISPDGRLRATAELNKEVRVWEVPTGRPMGRPMTTRDTPVQMEFSPDSRLIVVLEAGFGRANLTSSLRVWETSTGLPCGPSLAVDDLPIEFRFHPEARALTCVLPYDSPAARIFRLPTADIPLAEMERATWQITGSRMDETGNIEAIPQE